MADYKNIKGFNIQYLDSDPPNPIEGQMWFNSTTQTLKGAEVGGAPLGTWASGGAVNTARGWAASAGTQTAGMIMGGDPGARTDKTELYNGTSWTEVNDLNLIRGQNVGAGLQTASITFGGISPPQSPSSITNTESWNGTKLDGS
jgi:hypothetical protein